MCCLNHGVAFWHIQTVSNHCSLKSFVVPTRRNNLCARLQWLKVTHRGSAVYAAQQQPKKKKSAAEFPRPVERLFRSSVLCLPTIHLRCFSQQTSWERDNEGGTKNCWVERLVLMVTSGPTLLLLAVSGTVALLQLGSVLMFTVPITTGAYLCKPCVEGLGP